MAVYLRTAQEVQTGIAGRFKARRLGLNLTPVSYTHLDVYKRQRLHHAAKLGFTFSEGAWNDELETRGKAGSCADSLVVMPGAPEAITSSADGFSGLS